MNLLDVLDGREWSIQQAIQTTYPFDPQFYSNYVRPRLHRRNCELPLVLVDGSRYNREITSATWREAPIGTDYLLEPVQSPGVFHPKINLFASERSVFYSVSSANITLEEYCKAAQLGFADGFQKPTDEDEVPQIGESYFIARSIRDFYTALNERGQFITGQDARTYITETAETLSWLDEIETAKLHDEERTTWFVSNLDEPIVPQLLEKVAQNGGGIERVQLYAPYFGSPNVLRQLAERLDANHIELLVESESTALATDGLPEALSPFDYSVRRMEVNQATRWVHGKFMVLDGEWGQACLYGSPNMTSTALLESASQGNVEAGLVTVARDEDTLREAVFDSSAFRFSVSDPVDSLDTLDLRSASYEGWESRDQRNPEKIRLADVRLTQAETEEESELILTVAGLSESQDILVQTDTGAKKTVEVSGEESPEEVSVLIASDEQEQWLDAVATVVAGDAKSNPRRIVEEVQAYYRELREMTRSGGTQSSNTLLREVLENPDTAAVNVFDIALSELQERAAQADEGSTSSNRQQNEPDGERPPPNITRGGGSLPSLNSLVKNHLTYHREQALATITVEDRPQAKTLERFIEHAETFWETIELCFALEQLEQLDSERINNEKLFSACKSEVTEWLSGLDTIVHQLNGIVAQAEQNPDVREDIFASRDGPIGDDEIWESMCEVLFLHPGVVLEFEHGSEYTVFTSRIGLGNRLVTVFIDVHPYIGQCLITGPNVMEQVKIMLNNLSVELGNDEGEVTLLGQGIQVLLLYILVQRFATPERFFEGATPHPDVSEESFSVLAEYVIEAEELLVSYGMMSPVMISVTLREDLNKIKSMA